MPSYLNDMEQQGLIVIGRPVNGEFESAAAIEQAADFVDELATEHGLPLLGFVYAGTTVNWPEMFEYTPCIIGLVTHVDHASDEADRKAPLPRAALAPHAIPEEIWTALAEHGIDLAADTGTYLAVAGWAWTQINGADGKPIVGVSAEDDGYVRIDDQERVMRGDEPLTMRTSYC